MILKKKRFLLFSALFFISVSFSGFLQENTEKILKDRWYEVYFGGAKSGKMHELAKEITEKGKEPVIVSEESSELKMSRMDMEISVNSKKVIHETKDGKILKIIYTQKMSGQEQEITGEIKDGFIAIAMSSMGQKREYKSKWEDDAISSYRAETLYGKHQFKEGEKFTYKGFLIETGQGFPVCTIEMEKKEEIDVRGKKMTLNKYKSSIDIMPNIESVEYRDENSKLIRSDIPAMNMTILFSEDAESSKLEAANITSNMLIECKTKMNTAERAVYKLASEKIKLNEKGLEDERQKIEKKENDEIILSVKKIVPDEKKVFEVPYKNDDMEEYLEDNAIIQCRDELLQKTAKDIIGPENNSWKIALILEKWVNKNIKTKDFSVGFASAKEVLKTRAGDCTEHAVLLAALARAAGIPSRLSAGLCYFEIGNKRLFGFHMWTELFVGKWIALDGTKPLGGIDARYISFNKTSAKGGTLPVDFLSSLLSAFSKLSVEVIESK